MGKGGESGTSVKSISNLKITPAEVGKHRTPGDAWMTCKGKVYDVSNWMDHPGGSVIFSHAGDDFTDVFAAFHPSSAIKDLDRFCIGELDESGVLGEEAEKLTAQKKFEKGYRDLRIKLISMGMYNADPVYYVFKVLSNVAILAASVCCAVLSTSFAVQMFGAVLLGLFWQQSGWLAHDFLHYQVFKSRFYGDLMGILVGNVWQGFSVQWWKTKHNTHHAVPNLVASSPEAADGDPDIDTMPILAWSLHMAKQAEHSEWGRFFIRWQAVLYFPVLLVARLSWCQQSWDFVWGNTRRLATKTAEDDMKRIKYPILEKIGLFIHYSGLLMIMFYSMPILNGLAYFIVAQTSCGLMLALVFGLGHNGMAVYPANERPDWWKLQVTTTRNVTSNLFTDWFCGGLQYQVDHHLFPMIPRHNLGKVNKMVHQFCVDHKVSYHEADMWTGTIEVLSHLSAVSTEFLAEFPAM